jgi:hypothetical protein
MQVWHLLIVNDVFNHLAWNESKSFIPILIITTILVEILGYSINRIQQKVKL